VSLERAGPVNILYVDHAEGLGGAEISLLGLLEALDRSRYRPLLACRPGPLADRAAALDVAVRFLPLARLKRSPVAPFRLAYGSLALAQLARREGAALLHANVLRAAVYAQPAAALAGLPWVWHVRDILDEGPTSRWLCRRSAAVIAISQPVAAALPCADRAAVIHNPIPAPRALAPRSRAELGLPEGGPLLASVGRLREWKGHHRFIEAAARVAAADPQARFAVIGGRVFGEDDEDRDYGAQLEAQAAALGLAGRIIFTGHREDLDAIWPQVDLLVHAGRAEPFGRVVAEAQRAGVAVVGFADGGLPEIVNSGWAGGTPETVETARTVQTVEVEGTGTEGRGGETVGMSGDETRSSAIDETGLLVPAGEVPALAAAMIELLVSPQRRRRMGQAGRIMAAERFDPARHARAVEAVYDGLLARAAIPR
jgi:glycosyltransferase involved in cell wall biosynthesis